MSYPGDEKTKKKQFSEDVENITVVPTVDSKYSIVTVIYITYNKYIIIKQL